MPSDKLKEFLDEEASFMANHLELSFSTARLSINTALVALANPSVPLNMRRPILSAAKDVTQGILRLLDSTGGRLDQSAEDIRRTTVPTLEAFEKIFDGMERDESDGDS